LGVSRQALQRHLREADSHPWSAARANEQWDDCTEPGRPGTNGSTERLEHPCK
jgi:hypothetical protein